jgi:hypothetical protein
MLIPTSNDMLQQLRDIRKFRNHLSGELPPDLGKHLLLANLEVFNNNLSAHSVRKYGRSQSCNM